jgi:hypothetical protein
MKAIGSNLHCDIAALNLGLILELRAALLEQLRERGARITNPHSDIEQILYWAEQLHNGQSFEVATQNGSAIPGALRILCERSFACPCVHCASCYGQSSQ